MFPDPSVRFSLGDLTAYGFSAASRATFFALPGLDLVLDIGWCVEPMRNLSRVFLSHFHQDHSLALPTWVGWRQAAAVPPVVYTHREAAAGVRELLDVFARAERTPLRCEVHGLAEGDRVDLGDGTTLEAFETPHHLPTLGLLLWKRRSRLRREFRGLSGEQVGALVRQGVAVKEEVEVPVLCYTSDTTPELFDRRPDLLDAEVLMTECSHLDGYLCFNPDDASRLGERDVTHCHIRPLARRLAGFRGAVLAIGHTPRQYEACDLRAYLLPRLPAEQRRKLVVVPYRDQPFPEVQPPPPSGVPGAADASADPVALERLPAGTWQVREHPGYFGRRKAEVRARLARQYPGHQMAWEWEGGLITHRSALQLYEDAYLHFLRDNPELLEWLVERASDVYDTHPSNVHSGLDYLAQQPDQPTHLQDVAIRRVLRRLGRGFRGRSLLEIRGLGSEGYALNPGQVPFHRPEQIRSPGWQADWALPGSVECFWQSNKAVVTPA